MGLDEFETAQQLGLAGINPQNVLAVDTKVDQIPMSFPSSLCKESTGCFNNLQSSFIKDAVNAKSWDARPQFQIDRILWSQQVQSKGPHNYTEDL